MSSIIAIGNPGGGKSTILNGFAGQLLFQSGVSIGSGLTKQLESKTLKGITYIDQRYLGGPGLLWGFINPRNFHFYCIFGPLFWPVGFHQGQNFSKIFEQSSKIFEKSTIFRKKANFCPFLP